MDLRALGFDQWFEEHVGDLLQPEHSLARVTAVDRGAFLVRDQQGETRAELAGKLRFSAQSSMDLPCAGDWVAVQHHASDGPAIIHMVLPRRSVLRRKNPGKTADFQVIAANVDVAFIVQSCHYDFNVRRLDRYLVMAGEDHIEPVIILSKSDLIAADALQATIAQIRHAGISTRVFALSNTTGYGLDAFREFLVPGKTYCLLGSSGVGKTTLINRLIGRDVFDTKAVSSTGEGTHATTRRQLVVLDHGAMLIDMPGMRELGILGASDGMSGSFADIHDLSLDCRFSDCTHTQEPGCAVLSAIESGKLSLERFQSYGKLKRESEYNEMTYLDKRKKGRAFARFINSVKKHKKN